MEPKVLKIGIHKYSINEGKLDEWGRTEWGPHKITIHAPLREVDKRMTLLHEILHVTLMHDGVKGEEAEKLCGAMEYPLFEILVRNEGVMRYIGGYK